MGTNVESASSERPLLDSRATSPSLLMRAQANQAEAWERLVDLYAPLVYHWCRREQLSPEDTADVFQEVFRSVAEHLGSFRRDRVGDTFRGWLRTITRNKIRDLFRYRQGQPQAAGGTDAQLHLLAVPDPVLDPDPSENDLLHHQLHRTLELIRGEFEDRTWQAFWKVQIEEKDTRDVGAELGMTAAAVRKAKLRVLQRLRQEMGELLE
jgi:RNA polymerase sigma-70 factor (ECF subfamily)